MKKVIWIVCILLWVLLITLVNTNVIDGYGIYTGIIDGTTPGYLTDYYENIGLFGGIKACIVAIGAFLLLWFIPVSICKRLDKKEEEQIKKNMDNERIPFWKQASTKEQE